jgi:hypothetical protein
MDEREILKGKFSRLRRRAGFGAQIILVGLALEIVVLLVFAKDKLWLETTGLIVTTAVVLVGVWVEHGSGRKAEDIADELQRFSDERIAEFEARAAEANQRAEEASLQLARFRESRTLGPEQIDIIAEKLSKYSGIQYDGALSFPDPELHTLLEVIERGLEKAGWIGIDWTAAGVGFAISRSGAPRIGTGVSAIGVVVGISGSGTRSSEEILPLLPLVRAGTALADALMAEGIEAVFSWLPNIPSPNENALHIRIGRKA